MRGVVLTYLKFEVREIVGDAVQPTEGEGCMKFVRVANADSQRK